MWKFYQQGFLLKICQISAIFYCETEKIPAAQIFSSRYRHYFITLIYNVIIWEMLQLVNFSRQALYSFPGPGSVRVGSDLYDYSQ